MKYFSNINSFKVPSILTDMIKFGQKITTLQSECAKLLPILSEKFNWYIEPKIPLRILKKLFKLINEDEINTILIEHYKNRIDAIHSELISLFPERKNIFDELFYAHNHGLYYSSCVLAMTQIDGVVYDLHKKNYFRTNFVSQYLNNLNVKSNTLGFVFLKQLLNNELPIRLSEKDRTLDFKHLNRHQIVHGEITDYNSEINSLKAISLLAAIAFNLHYMELKEE